MKDKQIISNHVLNSFWIFLVCFAGPGCMVTVGVLMMSLSNPGSYPNQSVAAKTSQERLHWTQKTRYPKWFDIFARINEYVIVKIIH